MRRREFIGIAAGLAACPLTANAQQVKKPYRIGYIALSSRVPWIDGMVDGLRELGYVEGQNLEIVWRLAAGKRDLIPEMAAELVRLASPVTVPGAAHSIMTTHATEVARLIAENVSKAEALT
jgi:putative tryptophan/tyrosine transport system substrate-binding protein